MEQANNALILWTPISLSSATAASRSRHLHISAIVVYAAKLSTEASIKYSFYEQLQNVSTKASRLDVVIMAVDWYARAGKLTSPHYWRTRIIQTLGE